MLNANRLRLFSLALSLAACGPNFRYVYDSETSFERCYSEDFNPSSDRDTRTRCWQSFLQSYTYGASADHVAYAQGRIAHPELSPSSAIQRSSGSIAPPASSPGAPLPPAATAPTPAPTTPVASAPVAPLPAPTPSTAPTPAPTNEPPGATCSNECRSRWSACSQACQGGAAACVAACDDTFRDCMRGCF